MKGCSATKDGFIRLFCFFLGLIVLLVCVNHIMTDKTAKKSLYALRYEKKDTIDVIFLGNSHANQAFLPMELWEEHGYTAYSMTMMSQTFPLVYYCAEDAIRLQHPEILVVDLFAATSFDNDFDNMHKTIDNLLFPTRMKAIDEFVPEDKKTEYMFPLYLYHDRWDELRKKDVIPYFLRYMPILNPHKGAAMVSGHTPCNKPENAIQCAYSGECSELSEESLYWYNRLKELCQSNNTELLFVVVPYEAPVECTEDATITQMKLFNATEQWCLQNDVGYLNLFRNVDEMGFDFSTDLADVSHLNVLGAKKVTDFVGSYLLTHYEITDNRSNEALSKKWDAYYQRYIPIRDQEISACGGAQG